MADFSFSALADNQHVEFSAAADRLLFDAAVHAGLVQLAEVAGSVSATFGSKTVFLDGVTLVELRLNAFSFANGGRIALGDATVGVLPDWYGQNIDLSTSTASNQLQGLGGADYLQGGSGNDLLVGNTPFTPLVHVSRSGGTGATTATNFPTISADGNLVGFEGGWTGFGSANDTATDIFVKNLTSGSFSNENQSSTGVTGNSGSGAPVVSADGHFIAFLSASSNLVPDADSSSYDIYVASLDNMDIERASTGTGGTLAMDGASENPDLSGNGRYVAFESNTSNWDSNGSTASTDIYVKDRATGTLTRVTTSLTGGDGNGDSANAHISNDGRFVVFESTSSNLTAGDTNGRLDVFVWDRNSGDIVNLSDYMVGATLPNSDVRNADIAWDKGWGGVIVFETAKGLVAGDTNNQVDIYAFNMIDETFQLVSSRKNGAGVALSSADASVSGDGRFVVFTSFSDDLVAGDNNGFRDVYVKDLFTGEIALVSRTAAGAGGNQHSESAQISLGGDWIVFESSASNLAGGTDGNGGGSDIFRVSNPLLRDTLVGGDGNDTYVIDREDVIVEDAAAGRDLVKSSIAYQLVANVEDLQLTGSANIAGTGNTLANTLTGNGGNNKLTGLAGNDVLNGGGGRDVLVGGAGRDLLSGGAGNDVYDFNALSELGLGAARDVIKGWNAGDVIDLRGIDARPTLAGDQAFTFRGTSAFTGAGQVRYQNGVLQFNTDADLAVEFEIVITGTPPANLVAGTDLLL